MGNRSKQRKKQKDLKAKQKILKKCVLVCECQYVSTCPTCGHRICNSNSNCCRKCTESEMCPMRGIK